MDDFRLAPEARDRTPLEREVLLLAVAVAERTAQAKREMPGMDLTRARRAVDATIALAHATSLLARTVGLEEVAADERSILAAGGGPAQA
jgi:hypothetical protein